MVFENFISAQSFFLWATFAIALVMGTLVAALVDMHLLPNGLRRLDKV
jgi:uncharacterized membrane-anchored protein YhcB (DUF1043 family)